MNEDPDEVAQRLLLISLISLLFLPVRAQNPEPGGTAAADSSKTLRLTARTGKVMWPEYATFQTPPREDSVVPEGLYLRMQGIAYFKNSEFKNPFVTGRSLIGFNFIPSLEYHPDRKTTIRAGAYLLKYQGEDQFDRKVPVLTLQYDATDHLSLVFGTIYGTVNHGLVEPVEDFDEYLTNNYENGVQFLWNYPQFKSDVWLNWEKFLKPGDPFQERFTAGTNCSFTFFDSGIFSISAPFSAVFRHQGGEFDATNLPASTQGNLVQGLRLDWTLKGPFVKSAALIQDYLQFIEIHPASTVTIPYGSGSYSRFFVDTKIGSFQVGFWNAHNWVAPHGNPLFESISQKDSSFVQADRKMIVFKYQFEKDLSRYLKFVIRFEPYYHYETGRIDHSWGISMVLDDSFLIARTKETR
jgi:hypothetical protein